MMEVMVGSWLARYLGRHHWGIAATFIALGGTAYAATALPPNSVGTTQLRAGAVTLSKIGSGARRSLRAVPPLQPQIKAKYFSQHTGVEGVLGWVDYGHGYPGATYYRDQEGIVHLDGVVQSYLFAPPGIPPQYSNLCTNERPPIFLLPPAYRPSQRRVFAVDSNYHHGRVDVTAQGQVICMSGAGDQYVSLDGITFRAGG